MEVVYQSEYIQSLSLYSLSKLVVIPDDKVRSQKVNLEMYRQMTEATSQTFRRIDKTS